MSRDKFDKSKGRNDLEVSTVQSGKIGSVSFKLHKLKKVKKLIKHSTSFMKRQWEKRHILSAEQINIIRSAKKNNYTYLNRIKDKRDRKDFEVHDKKQNCALYYAVAEDSYEAADLLINQSKLLINKYSRLRNQL